MSSSRSAYSLRVERKRPLRFIENEEIDGGGKSESERITDRSAPTQRPKRSAKPTLKKREEVEELQETSDDDRPVAAEDAKGESGQTIQQVLEPSDAQLTDARNKIRTLEETASSMRRWIINVWLKRVLQKNMHWRGERKMIPVAVKHKVPVEIMKTIFGDVDVVLRTQVELRQVLPEDVLVKEGKGGCWTQIIPPLGVGKKEIYLNLASYLQTGFRQANGHSVRSSVVHFLIVLIVIQVKEQGKIPRLMREELFGKGPNFLAGPLGSPRAKGTEQGAGVALLDDVAATRATRVTREEVAGPDCLPQVGSLVPLT